MKKYIFIFFVVLVVIVTGYVVRTLVLTKKGAIEPVHIHAGFKIVVNGNEIDFADPNNMYIKPCGIEEVEEYQHVQDRIHLHDGIGNVAHIHARGVSWQDLFESLGMEVSPDNALSIVNGKREEKISERVIEDLDSAVFVYTEGLSEFNFENWKDRGVDVEHIRTVGLSKESCDT